MKTKTSYSGANKHSRAGGLASSAMRPGGARPGTQTPVGHKITSCSHGPGAELGLYDGKAMGGHKVKSPTQGQPPGGRVKGAKRR